VTTAYIGSDTRILIDLDHHFQLKVWEIKASLS
jgi:hypothetical protein